MATAENYHATPAEIETAFRRLGRALARTKLPTDGTVRGARVYRQAQPDEFMWMFRDQGGDHFKHRDSRCYVYLRRTGELTWGPNDHFDA